jgi:hypothetical protein
MPAALPGGWPKKSTLPYSTPYSDKDEVYPTSGNAPADIHEFQLVYLFT